MVQAMENEQSRDQYQHTGISKTRQETKCSPGEVKTRDQRCRGAMDNPNSKSINRSEPQQIIKTKGEGNWERLTIKKCRAMTINTEKLVRNSDNLAT